MKIISLQNISYDRGTDRIVEVAHLCPSHQFWICGMPRDAWGEQFITECELPDNCSFTGEVNPITALKEADLLLRLTRRNDPWGRDVIEALTLGVPVIATGTWEGFIQDGINGFLIWPFTSLTVMERVNFIAQYGLPACYENRFSLQNARKVERIYASLIRDK